MADIGVALRAKLATDGTVPGLVSARIYPHRLPQGATLPAVVYHRVGGADEAGLDGLHGICHQRLQIDCYAATRLVADQVATAVRDAIAGDSGRGTWGTVFVCGVTPQGGPRDDEQTKGDGSDDPMQIVIRDYLVSYVG